jgi:outer membrane protein
MNLRFLPVTLAISAAFAGSAQAQNLTSLFETARGYDATYKAAQSQYTANLSKGEQAKALLLPTVGLTANLNKTEFERLTPPPGTFSAQSGALTLNASHPLYRPANSASYQQGMRQLELASIQLKAAEQDLMVRLSQAYFDVLISRESLEFVRAQKMAVAEQLAAAKRNFEVGTSTITDSREAQARYDLVLSQEIAADNDLRIKRMALNQLVGLNNIEPQSLSSKAKLTAPESSSIDQWVRQSSEFNPVVLQNRAALDIAKLETTKAEAGHKPTLDLVAGFTPTRYKNGTGINSAQIDNNLTSISLSFNMP